jgi:hypothetical protein
MILAQGTSKGHPAPPQSQRTAMTNRIRTATVQIAAMGGATAVVMVAEIDLTTRTNFKCKRIFSKT